MPEPFLHTGGNYRSLLAFRKAECVFDVTNVFVQRFLRRGDRTVDQMVQAARSGKQNIVEGVVDSAISKQTEIKLIGVAIGSLHELMADYTDYLRVRGLAQWSLRDEQGKTMVEMCRNSNDPLFFTQIARTNSDEFVANMALTLIYQTDRLLQGYLRRIQVDFLEHGGLREQMTAARKNYKNNR